MALSLARQIGFTRSLAFSRSINILLNAVEVYQEDYGPSPQLQQISIAQLLSVAFCWFILGEVVVLIHSMQLWRPSLCDCLVRFPFFKAAFGLSGNKQDTLSECVFHCPK